MSECDAPSRRGRDGVVRVGLFWPECAGLVHGDGERAAGYWRDRRVSRAGYGESVGSGCGSGASVVSTAAPTTAATGQCANYGHHNQDAEQVAPATTPSRDSEEDEDREDGPGTGTEPAFTFANFRIDQIGGWGGGCDGCFRRAACRS